MQKGEFLVWFRKPFTKLTGAGKRNIPDGLWTKCASCGKLVYNKKLVDNLKVCPECNFHFRMSAVERLNLLADNESWKEYDKELKSIDPLKFVDSKGYAERIKEAEEKTGLSEAVITGEASVDDNAVIMAILDFAFLGGSMASVVGEKICRALERAMEKKYPFISVSSSGGARMQEGILSLMQMSKTAAALGQFSQARLFHLAILTNPTTGGVSASFASLGDVTIAEPGALIGFAGPRVIKQTIHQDLPSGFQSSEFLLQHGMLDMIVPRARLKPTISKLLRLFSTRR